MATSDSRLLIIEDEPGIALALYRSLSKSAYKIDTAKTGASGLRKAANKKFDAILLDLGLPDMSGLTICRQLRRDGVTAPIIVLTAENGITSKVSLLDAGANDYVLKPFSMDELQARIRAVLRTSQMVVDKPDITIGPLVLNHANRTVTRDDQVIRLRRKEFSLLEFLMTHVGAPVTRAALMQYAWEGSEDGWTNTIDVHIKHLRDKVDRPFDLQLIKTVHGVGYKLEIPNAIAKIS
jgi:two-component system OmpR family response regulator